MLMEQIEYRNASGICLPEAFLYSLLTPAQVLRRLSIVEDIDQQCDPMPKSNSLSYSSAEYTTKHLRGVVTSRHFSLQNTNECVIRSKRTCLSHTTVIL